MEKERRRIKALWAGISGAIYGGIVGAIIGASFGGGEGFWIGAAAGALYFGVVEAITDIRREPGELKPLWHRLIAAVTVGAAVAVLISIILSRAGPVAIGLIVGLLTGLMGLGPRKLALGLGAGFIIGLLGTVPADGINPAVIGGAVVLVYRLTLLLIFKESDPIQIAGERVAQQDLQFVVPFEAHSQYVGADYAKSLSEEIDGLFKRNLPGIGILESLDSLRGPHFNPELVDPLIREFYEHTSRFKLTIIPQWNPFVRPFFWLFKTFIARRIGQADIPFNIKEAQRGMVSFIDTIDYSGRGNDDPIQTLRIWIRAYEDTDQAIYVGIYTVLRHQEIGYVSVGFPLPEANFTATLMPYNNRGSGLLLKTMNTGSRFPGHYLSDVDNGAGESDGEKKLTTLELTTMDEEIDVYVEEGDLKTKHRFYFSGSKFLTLHYTIQRIEGDIQA